jgi:Cobalamin biosynthesis protein CobT (nicotinate-mononucleotide:5, 6-dimethylbenzimidazole phosphoribosyltransferase)
MARKDSEKDSERPHYYSQFWLDVAAGRRVIGAPKPEEGEAVEPEVAEATIPQQDYTVEAAAPANHSEAIKHPVVEPAEDPAVDVEPDAAASSDQDNIDDTPASEDEGNFEVPDVDLENSEEEGEYTDNHEEEGDDDFYEDEDEDEDEEEDDDEMNWGRGRKKKSPRTTKPVAKKPGKRDTRRGY